MSQMGMQPNNSTRPGQMTAVMRAMSVQTGPKVLRLGLVQGGRVLEERIIKQRTSVTVGANEKAMFVLQAQNLPANFKLFELIGADYYLNFIDGMNGRLALTSGITDLAALRGQAKKVGNAYQVRLTEDARGKVVIGDTTFLFQFVEPPPVQPRPQLPLSVRGGVANEIDWTLTIIAAFSFLVHFGFVGAMYSDWMDPPVSEGISVSALIDQLKNIPTPPPLEVPTDTTVSPTATAANTAAPASKPAGGGQHASTGGAGKSSSVSDAKAAALTQQAEAMQMQLLAALGGASSVSGALGRNGEIPPVDLSAAAASGAGVSGTGGDLRTGSGGGPVQGGGGRGGLGGIGGGTGSSGTGTTAGAETRVVGPTGVAQVGGSSATVPVSDADRVIAGLRPRFRACYQAGLNTDPSMAGKVQIMAKIGPNGEVSSASVASNTGLSASVASCIARHVKNAQFSAPGGSGSTLSIPVTFVQQSK